ncbi:conjugal transfer protein TraG N-terminal domain-containing protein [Shewanella aestuarii]|uniref:TraG N-terminal Proteobacteria domain-containing protein n=1 Tax=Shewanella aestuarii TaxID=1028752 RepID=A0A6G9QQW0_9GAMM|nr:conjugal transfer protein TraG N-terminal domain-containing protein [Shewanella aestuarii]QIR16427.1 hypothetical protein HBH39_18315 [Shewanella aestuarii]
MTGFEVYSMGNPEFLIEIFKGLSRMWSTNDIFVLFGIALLLGLMAGMFKWAIDQDKSPFPAKGFIISILVVVGLLGPQSLVDVTVISKRDNTYQNISNVPLLPALSGWMITGTITVVADQFAQAFSVVGVANTWTAFSPIQHFVGLGSVNYQPACVPIEGSEKTYNICKTLSRYLNDCYVSSTLLSPNKNEPLDVLAKASPKELIASIATSNKALDSTYFLSTNPAASDGIMASCIEVHTQLTNAVNSAHFNLALDKSSASQGLKLSEVDKFIAQQTPNGTIPEAESSLDLAKVMFLQSEFANYFNNSPYGNQVAKGMFDTVNQRHLANAQKKEYWMENAEIMQSFFEALCVFITPFIGVTLAFSGQGLLAVGQYFMVWVFVNLWAVMLVLVNGFMAMAMTGRFTENVAAGTSQFSLTSIDSQFTTANSYISMGGMLYTFIPAICIFVMYKGVHAMQGLASKSMADPSIKAERFAPDTGATVTNGQTAYGNQNSIYQNNTGEWNRGDTLAKTSATDYSVGSSTANSAGMAAQSLSTSAEQVANSRKSAVNEMFSQGNVGSYDYKNGESNQYTVGSKEAAVEAAAQAIQEATGMDISQARKVAASGTVSGEMGGALSFGYSNSNSDDSDGSNVKSSGLNAGFKLGAKAQAALGIDESASASEKKSLQESMDLAQRHSKEINASLANTKLASEGWSDTTSAAFQKSATEGAELARQEQALKQQSASLSAMQSRSSQVSASTQIGMSQLHSALGNQSIQDFLKSSDPGLWDKLQSQQYQLNDGKKGGIDDYLNEKTSDHLLSSNNTSVDGYAMAKGKALMNLLDQHDAIDLKAGNGGVDFDKERSDNQISQGIFQAMKDNGITGGAEGVDFYKQRGEQLDQMQNASQNINKVFDDSAKRLAQPNAEELATKSQKIESDSNQFRDDATKNTKNGMEDVARNNTDITSKANEVGMVIPQGVSENAADKINDAGRSVDGNSLAQTLHQSDNSILKPAADYFLKGSGGEAMGEYIINSVNSGNASNVDSVQDNYAKGMEKLNDIGAINTKVLDQGLRTDGPTQERFDAALAVISDQKFVDGLFTPEGNPTPVASQSFTDEQLSQIKAGNDWYKSYLNGNTKSDQIEQSLSRIEAGQNNNGNIASAYVDAQENRGKVASTVDTNSPADKTATALGMILDGKSALAVDQELGITGSGESFGRTYYDKGRFSDRAEHGADQQIEYNKLKDLGGKLESVMSPEQKQNYDDYLKHARETYKTEDYSTNSNQQNSPSVSTISMIAKEEEEEAVIPNSQVTKAEAGSVSGSDTPQTATPQAASGEVAKGEVAKGEVAKVETGKAEAGSVSGSETPSTAKSEAHVAEVASGEVASGETASGETAKAEAGSVSGSDTPQTATPQAASGEVAKGEVAKGDVAKGEVAKAETGKAEAGSVSGSETPSTAKSEAHVAEVASGEVASGETASGETAKAEAGSVSGSDTPQTATPQAASGEVAKGEVAKGDVAKGDVAKGEVAKPETGKAEAGSVSGSETPSTAKSEAHVAEVASGEVASGETAKAEAGSVSGSDTPQTATPQAASGEVAKGEVAKGDVAKGEVAKPETGKAEAGSVSGSDTPQTATPQAASGGVAKGEVAKGDVAKGDVAKGEVAKPETGKAEAGSVSGSDTPQTATPQAASGGVAKAETGNTETGSVRGSETPLTNDAGRNSVGTNNAGSNDVGANGKNSADSRNNISDEQKVTIKAQANENNGENTLATNEKASEMNQQNETRLTPSNFGFVGGR